jgi:ABC transporter substrate binding protein
MMVIAGLAARWIAWRRSVLHDRAHRPRREPPPSTRPPGTPTPSCLPRYVLAQRPIDPCLVAFTGRSVPLEPGDNVGVEAGGLMSYGPSFPALFRRAADFVDKILRGAKPADIPVEQPTQFDLVINLTTAKALGVTISPTLLAIADEVIE